MKHASRLTTALLAAAMGTTLTACSSSGSASSSSTAAASATAAASETSDLNISDDSLVGSGAPGGTGYVQDSVQRDVVTIAVPAMATTISPWAGTATGRHMIMYNMYQPLFEYDKTTGEYVYVLAENIEQLDTTTFEITLRDGIVDSAGNTFTASDAAYSIETCRDLGNVSGMKYIDSVSVVDDKTLDVTMNTEADYQFASSVSMIMMVTQKAYEESGDEMGSNPIGTGPYVLTDFESGTSATFEKIDDYWGADLADRDTNPNSWYYFASNVDRIEYVKISEASQQSIALETGTADVAYRMTGDEANRIKSEDDFNVYETMDSQSYNLFFNCGDESVMSSQELRQAVCYAIDVPAILEMNGGYGRLSTTFGSVIFEDVNPAWAEEDYYGYDVEKAQELIEASGYDSSQQIRIMVSTNSSETVSIAQIVQSYLMAVGLNVTIDQYDGASFAENKYNPDLYDIRIDAASYMNLVDLWTQFLDSGTNDVSYAQIKDTELEGLLANLQQAENRTTENIDAVHYYIKDKAYCYGLYCRELFDATTDDIVEFAYMPKLYGMPGAFCYTE